MSLRPLQQIPPHPRDFNSKYSHQPFWTSSKPDWQAALAGYWRDPLANAGEPLRLDTGRILSRIHRQGGLGGIHWRATLRYSAGCLAGSTGRLLWCDTSWDLLASYSGEILWRDTLAGYSAGSTGKLLWDTQRAARRDPLAGGILGGIHWRATLGYSAGYSAGSTGEQLWRDTGRDPLASCSGGILGGIHWRAALAGYWVGAWCRSIANADSNIKSNNPFLSGGEKHILRSMEAFTTLRMPFGASCSIGSCYAPRFPWSSRVVMVSLAESLPPTKKAAWVFPSLFGEPSKPRIRPTCQGRTQGFSPPPPKEVSVTIF